MDRNKSSGKKFQVFIVSLLGIAAVISAINVFARLRLDNASAIQNITTILGVIITLGAGWITVRKYGFGLGHTVVIGIVLSFGSHWTLPVFHQGFEILNLALVNTSVFIVMTLIGGAAAKLFEQYLEKRK